MENNTTIVTPCSNSECPYCKGTGIIKVDCTTTGHEAYYQCYSNGSMTEIPGATAYATKLHQAQQENAELHRQNDKLKQQAEGWRQPAALKPTFWDVAKAFKWAAEYRDEKGGQLTLYNDQWTIISEDEDGNENETQDLTPGNVAELYCLQNGFTKENDEQPAAGREEDDGTMYDATWGYPT